MCIKKQEANITPLLVGKSFSFVDVECKNILISADIGRAEIVYEIVQIWETENVLVLAYPEPLTGSELYQIKT